MKTVLLDGMKTGSERFASSGQKEEQAKRPTVEKHDILCFSSIDWDFMWQGHQEIMSTLAGQGHRVLFIENTGVRAPGLRDIGRIHRRFLNWKRGLGGFRKEAENLYVFSPLILPFPYSRLARWVNRFFMLSALRRWMLVMNFSRPVCWTFLPTPLTLEVIRRIPRSALVYYCIDSFADSTPAARRIIPSEERMFREADLVFVTSHRLGEAARPWNKEVHVFPFGVRFEKFNNLNLKPNGEPVELAGFAEPIVGYIGGLHQWVDQDLIVQAARACRDYTFVLVGPEQTDVERLRREPNIHLVGSKPHNDLPRYLRCFKVGMIPYRVTDYTNHVYPTKLNEYHACGKAVVSTPLPEVLAFNRQFGGLVNIGATRQTFIAALKKAVVENSDVQIKERVAAAYENSWTRRIQSMQALVREQIIQKDLTSQENWTARLRVMLREQQAFTRTVVSLLFAVLLIFYTPLIDIAARPLQVGTQPVPSDAIVVFAGGVSESGRAGERYRWQVARAADLYEQGYASRILFVSSSVRAFRETDIMRLLTESLGIPQSAILTESHARNTYEYALKVGEAAEREAWNSILLLTTSYNERRAVLAFQKNIPQLNVVVASEKSPNARRGWRVQLSEVYKVVNEYIALAYYKWKGWI